MVRHGCRHNGPGPPCQPARCAMPRCGRLRGCQLPTPAIVPLTAQSRGDPQLIAACEDRRFSVEGRTSHPAVVVSSLEPSAPHPLFNETSSRPVWLMRMGRGLSLFGPWPSARESQAYMQLFIGVGRLVAPPHSKKPSALPTMSSTRPPPLCSSRASALVTTTTASATCTHAVGTVSRTAKALSPFSAVAGARRHHLRLGRVSRSASRHIGRKRRGARSSLLSLW